MSEVQATEESNSACYKENSYRHHSHVTEVQQIGDEHVALQSGEVEHGIKKNVHRRATSAKQTLPPPSVVFGTKAEVDQHNTDLSASHA